MSCHASQRAPRCRCSLVGVGDPLVMLAILLRPQRAPGKAACAISELVVTRIRNPTISGRIEDQLSQIAVSWLQIAKNRQRRASLGERQSLPVIRTRFSDPSPNRRKGLYIESIRQRGDESLYADATLEFHQPVAREGVMKQPQIPKHQACTHCGGPFGMVTHRWWGNKFCKKTCKDSYLRELALDRQSVAGFRTPLVSER